MDEVILIDNINRTLQSDLAEEIKTGSKVSIAAACFSIYAYQQLKIQLKDVEQLRFIFTQPTFVSEKEKEEKKEFYIPSISSERSLYGTEFEIRLRNELTQKAIAKECADWIKEKATFKSNITNDDMMGFINVDSSNYMPVKGFTTVDLGLERGNNAYYYIHKTHTPFAERYMELFDTLWYDTKRVKDVTDEVIENITAAYAENSPEYIYFVALYNIFCEFLNDISEDVLPNESVGFMNTVIWSKLYNFQRDAALAIINKLEKYNGCILADSVGLGKTFTALAVIKYYEKRNKSVLVLCPKKLENNWNMYRNRYKNNPLSDDRFAYDVLFHTDLSRTSGMSNGNDLALIDWENYDLVVIDESHNFRNGGKISSDEDSETNNRYLRLLNNVIRKGVRTKVLMLSATPVNNRFNDLKNQLQLAYEGDSQQINSLLKTTHTIDEIFRSAQKEFNAWSKLPAELRTTETLRRSLNKDFFEVLDAVTIARSRKQIEKYYDTADIGKFPSRLPPISKSPCFTNKKNAINYDEIFEQLLQLELTIYLPTHFIQPSKIDKYTDQYDSKTVSKGFTQANREQGIRRLMAINLMKRMESSVHSFGLTINRIYDQIQNTIKTIDEFEKRPLQIELDDISQLNADEFDADDQNNDDISTIGRKVKIDLADMDWESWRNSLKKDKETLELLITFINDITPEYDCKLQELMSVLKNKIEHPINPGNKKVIIFTAFADTAEYLFENIGKYMMENFGLNTAMITGNVSGKTTAKNIPSDMNAVLTCFSPLSKDKALIYPEIKEELDILIATDCISEGQNLQDCDYLINYDIHWNPVRIIQRFGRIDRIGSRNRVIQLVNFWPDISLDDYINLKSRVETRMKIVDMTATGDDNLLSSDEKLDLEYRKKQLLRLQSEVVDIEDISGGISIMDLGLNEFRLDLLDYYKNHPELENAPCGLHAVAAASTDTPPGVVFVLKNRNNAVNKENANRLHPYYMVYISNDGEVICDHLEPKALLNRMRHICRGKTQLIPELYRAFNKQTRDGRNMSEVSRLLGQAISSIIEVKEQSDIDDFLGGGQVSFLEDEIKGLDDFELICLLVVK